MIENKVLVRLAEKFIERSNALAYKGKARDRAALDYFLGAAAGFELAGDSRKASEIGFFCAMVLCVRGYREIEALTKGGK